MEDTDHTEISVAFVPCGPCLPWLLSSVASVVENEFPAVEQGPEGVDQRRFYVDPGA